MKLFKRVIDTLGLATRDERPLDIHLTQEDIETELHYARPVREPESLRVTLVDSPKP